MKQLLLLLVLLILLPCAAQAQDFTHDSIKIDRHQRHFYFKKPNNKSAKNLLFVLHFSGGTAQDMITMAATLQAKADAENLLIVYPQGYKSYWNDCRKASNAAANIENIDELAFFEAMIQYCTKNYGIDPKKIYAAGFSGGGHIAYKLALNLRTPLAGIAAVAASLPTNINNDCLPHAHTHPLCVLIANGTNDDVSPYNGGEIKASNIVLGNVLPTPQTTQYWAKVNGLNIKPTLKILPNTNNDDIFIEQYTYAHKNKPTLTLLKVVGGKHQLPTDIDVFDFSWIFFKENMKK